MKAYERIHYVLYLKRVEKLGDVSEKQDVLCSHHHSNQRRLWQLVPCETSRTKNYISSSHHHPS